MHYSNCQNVKIKCIMFLDINSRKKRHLKMFMLSLLWGAIQGVRKELAPWLRVLATFKFLHNPAIMVVNKFFNLPKSGLIFHTLRRVIYISHSLLLEYGPHAAQWCFGQWRAKCRMAIYGVPTLKHGSVFFSTISIKRGNGNTNDAKMRM